MEPLWVGLVLLGLMQTQAQDPKRQGGLLPTLAPNLRFHKICLQPSPGKEGFQGDWFVLGLAGNTFRREDQARFGMWAITFGTRGQQCVITSVLLRAPPCKHRARTPVLETQPGQAPLGGWEELRPENFEVEVVEVDSEHFILLLYTEPEGQGRRFQATLLGRKKELKVALRGTFIRFAGTLGVPQNHIIFPPKAECNLEP